MIRHFGVLSVYMLAITLGSALFFTSQNVQLAERTLSDLRTKIGIEQDSLKILKAEWTYLNRPDRLENLAATYLDLAPADTRELYVSIKDMPAIHSDAAPSTSEIAHTETPDTHNKIKAASLSKPLHTDGSTLQTASADMDAAALARSSPATASSLAFSQMMTRITTKGDAP